MKTDLLFSSFPFIPGEDVNLHHLSEMDIQPLWKIMSAYENYRFSPTTATDVKGDIPEKIRKTYDLFNAQKAVTLGIYSNDSANLVGLADITDVNPDVECVTISFMIHHHYRRYGYGSSTVDALCRYLIDRIAVRRIQAMILPIDNDAQNTYRRCGFQCEGTIREGFFWPDKGIVDLSIYSLLSHEIHKARKTGGTSLF